MDQSTIYNKLYEFFEPEILEVTNDSHKHAGHTNSPNTGNSHFSVVIKSKKLEGLSRLKGQRQIFNVLDKEMNTFIHALSIKII